jgi:hypothetical protein
MNKKELEKEIDYLINPEDRLLWCKVNFTKTIEIEKPWTLKISASIVDEIGNIYADFLITSVLSLKILNKEEEVTEKMYKELKNNILKWIIFGKTCNTALSLTDSINCAKVLKYNR